MGTVTPYGPCRHDAEAVPPHLLLQPSHHPHQTPYFWGGRRPPAPAEPSFPRASTPPPGSRCSHRPLGSRPPKKESSWDTETPAIYGENSVAGEAPRPGQAEDLPSPSKPSGRQVTPRISPRCVLNRSARPCSGLYHPDCLRIRRSDLSLDLSLSSVYLSDLICLSCYESRPFRCVLW